MDFSLVMASGGYFLVAVQEPLIEVLSLFVQPQALGCRLQYCLDALIMIMCKSVLLFIR